MIVNTSVKVLGNPIVGSPEDAFRFFMGPTSRRRPLGAYFLRKEDGDVAFKKDWRGAFELDRPLE